MAQSDEKIGGFMAISLNTHKFYNELKGAGFTEQQAEVIANIQGKISQVTVEQAKHDYRLDDVTTSQDLELRAKETDLKIELVRRDIKRFKIKNHDAVINYATRHTVYKMDK